MSFGIKLTQEEVSIPILSFQVEEQTRKTVLVDLIQVTLKDFVVLVEVGKTNNYEFIQT